MSVEERYKSQKVSIALCTYNGGKYLPEQLDSFLLQTRPPDEVVVSDDGSTDETIEVLNCFRMNAPFPVQVIQNERTLGSSQNFETVVQQCTGEIVFLSDQDDVWMPDKINAVLAEFHKDPQAGLVYSNAAIVSADLRPSGKRLWDILGTGKVRHENLHSMGLEALLLHRNYITGATAAFRADVLALLRQNPVPPGMIHDHWIATLIALDRRIVAIDEDLILYRQHPGQQIGIGTRNGGRRNGREGSRAARFTKIVHDLEAQYTAFEKLLSYSPSLEHDDHGHAKTLIERKLVYLKRCAEHYRVRLSLPRSFFDRSIRVLNESRTKRYFDCSSGFRSVFADLIGR